MRAQRSERRVDALVTRLRGRARDQLALVLAALLVALLGDPALAHMVVDVVTERRARRAAR